MGDNGVIAFLEGDNPQDPNWDQYGVDNVLWNANPSTTYYAFSFAKNVNDEWGPLTRVEFTTPASAGAKPAMSKAMPKRVISQTGVGVTKAPIFVGSTSKPVMKLEKK